jgi:hypothetical protein
LGAARLAMLLIRQPSQAASVIFECRNSDDP